jgi:hypothetical protein
MREYKDNKPCADCGVPYRFWILQFDHVISKRYNLGTQGKKLDEATLRAEMAYCDVVCANCHHERTHRRQLSPRKKK